jgi:hypothetical protein
VIQLVSIRRDGKGVNLSIIPLSPFSPHPLLSCVLALIPFSHVLCCQIRIKRIQRSPRLFPFTESIKFGVRLRGDSET